jgi:AcrR family transcriptional regulator
VKSKSDTSLPDGAAAPVGLRERGKQRRRNWIKEAARAVFYERGYEAATTREIAERAEVSLGTLFAYAPTKAELLLMIVNDDLATERGNDFEDATPDASLMESLMVFGLKNFTYWAKHPDLAREARREITGVLMMGKSAGPEAIRFAANKQRLQAGLAGLVERKRKAGSIKTTADIKVIVDMWWCIYNQQLHTWLASEKPSVSVGMQEIHGLYLLMMEAFMVQEWEKEVPGSILAPPRKSPTAKAAKASPATTVPKPAARKPRNPAKSKS